MLGIQELLLGVFLTRRAICKALRCCSLEQSSGVHQLTMETNSHIGCTRKENLEKEYH